MKTPMSQCRLLRIVSSAGMLAAAASTSLAQPGSGEYASGLLHQPAGAALLGPVTGRRVPVLNIGSSGQDGVEVRFDSLFGGGVMIDRELYNNIPGATFKIRHKGWDGLIYGNHRSVNNGDGTSTETYDFSDVGAISLNVETYDELGALISSTTTPGPIVDVGVVNRPIFCPCGWQTVYWWATVNGKPHLVSRNYCPCSGGGTGTPTGGPNNTSFARIVTPTLPAGTPDFVGMESMAVTSLGLPELTITGSDLGTFGATCWGLGQAHISEQCTNPAGCSPEERKLVANNIGSSGQDGVSIAVPNNGGVQWIRRDTCCPSPGHTTLMQVKAEDGSLISSLTESPSPLPDERDVSCDFSSLGASGVAVTCYDENGAVLFAFPYSTAGVTVRGPRCPTGSYWGFDSGTHSWGCLTIMNVVLPGGITVNGVHRVEYTALGATAAARPRSVEITASGVSEFSIENLLILPPRCVADVDNGSGSGTPDGGVGIEDLLYYLNLYDAGLPAADVDNGSNTGTPDGGVGIEDLLYYLQRYDAGC